MAVAPCPRTAPTPSTQTGPESLVGKAAVRSSPLTPRDPEVSSFPCGPSRPRHKSPGPKRSARERGRRRQASGSEDPEGRILLVEGGLASVQTLRDEEEIIRGWGQQVLLTFSLASPKTKPEPRVRALVNTTVDPKRDDHQNG